MKQQHFLQHVSRKQGTAGFTLIELMVVVAIFAIVASILMLNYTDYSTNISLRNLSEDVALAIRQAQSYATSTHSISTSSQENLEADTFQRYGVTFAIGETEPAPPIGSTEPSFYPDSKDFVLFADTGNVGDPGYGTYDAGSGCGNPTVGNECVQNYSIATGDQIVELCPITALGIDTNDCYSANNPGSATIVFHRPAPDAYVCLSDSVTTSCDDNGEGQDTTFSSGVEIILQSPKGQQRSVSVWNTGQISTSD